MQAGSKLDMLIARAVLGLPEKCSGEIDSSGEDAWGGVDYWCTECSAEDDIGLSSPHDRVPLPYSTDVAAAMKLMDALVHAGEEFRLDMKPDGTGKLYFHRNFPREAEIVNFDIPLAMCHAAMKTMRT